MVCQFILYFFEFSYLIPSMPDLKDAKTLVEIWDTIQERFSSKTGLLLAITLLGMVLIALFSNINFSSISYNQYAIILLAICLLVLIWFQQRSIKRHPRNSLGVGIAIECKDAEQQKNLKSDFIQNLNENLGFQPQSFNVIVHNDHCSKLASTNRGAIKIIKSSKANLLIFGNAKTRKIKGELHHVIKINVIIQHNTIPKEISVQVSQEIEPITTKKLVIDLANEFEELDISSKNMSLVSRYLVGLSLMLSNRPLESLDIFQKLKSTLAGLNEESVTEYVRLVEATDVGLLRIYRTLSSVKSTLFIHTWNSNYLIEAEKYADYFLEIRDYDYDIYLVKAICAVILRKDPNESYEMINKCNGENDYRWRLSVAFLNALEGDLDGAYRQYRKIFSQDVNHPAVIADVISFICKFIDHESGKDQLYYNLGLINFFGTEDFLSAKSDFTKFLELTDPDKFQLHHDHARKYISEI